MTSKALSFIDKMFVCCLTLLKLKVFHISSLLWEPLTQDDYIEPFFKPCLYVNTIVLFLVKTSFIQGQKFQVCLLITKKIALRKFLSFINMNYNILIKYYVESLQQKMFEITSKQKLLHSFN